MKPHNLPRLPPRPHPIVNCRDCTRIADNYMVEDDVWAQAFPEEKNPTHAGVLCFECLEVRLGRRLRLDDFKPLPVNRAIFLGAQIQKF